jgi:hypothetical protein
MSYRFVDSFRAGPYADKPITEYLQNIKQLRDDQWMGATMLFVDTAVFAPRSTAIGWHHYLVTDPTICEKQCDIYNLLSKNRHVVMRNWLSVLYKENVLVH